MLLLAGALTVVVVGRAAIGTDDEDEIFFGAAGGEEPAWRSAPLPLHPLAQEPVRQPARTASTVRIDDAHDELALDSEVHSADEAGGPTPDLGTRVSRADNDELELARGKLEVEQQRSAQFADRGARRMARAPFNARDYAWELLATFVLILYAINYFHGRAANMAIAKAWGLACYAMFHEQFAHIGEHGALLSCDTVQEFSAFLSGRDGCDWMHARLLLRGRHDLYQVLYSLVVPQRDRLLVDVALSDDVEAAFVLALELTRAEDAPGPRRGIIA